MLPLSHKSSANRPKQSCWRSLCAQFYIIKSAERNYLHSNSQTRLINIVFNPSLDWLAPPGHSYVHATGSQTWKPVQLVPHGSLAQAPSYGHALLTRALSGLGGISRAAVGCCVLQLWSSSTPSAHVRITVKTFVPQVYCIAYELLDKEWLQMRASYMDFSAVMKRVRAQLAAALATKPDSVARLRSLLLQPA